MRRTLESRTPLWSALGLWILAELLFSSRWWPPQRNPFPVPLAPPAHTTSNRVSTNRARRPLRALLQAVTGGAQVWIAPYSTYPEPGMLESHARQGVYDTLLSVPAAGPVRLNYGAAKLTPADALFSLASAQGLGAEWTLAGHLGYTRFALDLGAVTQPAVATQLCLRTPSCTLSSDDYALFVLPAPDSMAARLNALQRRQQLLPYRSAGPSWGALVFSPYEWRASQPLAPAHPSGSRPMLVRGVPGLRWQIYRYRLGRFPSRLRELLALRPGDVQLVLPSGMTALQVCIGVEGSPCQRVQLSVHQPVRAIGALLEPGQLTQITWLEGQGSSADGSALLVRLSLPQGMQELLSDAHTAPERL